MLAFFSVPALMANFSILPDSALLAFSDNDLQNLLNGFSNACDDFGLTISLKKTKIMTQDTEVSSSLFIKDYALETVKSFIYLGSTVTSTTSLDTEIGKRIGHAATNMSKLSHRVWENQKLTTPTKMAVYCLQYLYIYLDTILHSAKNITYVCAYTNRSVMRQGNRRKNIIKV